MARRRPIHRSHPSFRNDVPHGHSSTEHQVGGQELRRRRFQTGPFGVMLVTYQNYETARATNAIRRVSAIATRTQMRFRSLCIAPQYSQTKSITLEHRTRIPAVIQRSASSATVWPHHVVRIK
jgi:hypothetical protein